MYIIRPLCFFSVLDGTRIRFRPRITKQKHVFFCPARALDSFGLLQIFEKNQLILKCRFKYKLTLILLRSISNDYLFLALAKQLIANNILKSVEL